ncbi:hypothetical protein J3F84DRAFT_257649 [Trichoderma pleuroticola]
MEADEKPAHVTWESRGRVFSQRSSRDEPALPRLNQQIEIKFGGGCQFSSVQFSWQYKYSTYSKRLGATGSGNDLISIAFLACDKYTNTCASRTIIPIPPPQSNPVGQGPSCNSSISHGQQTGSVATVSPLLSLHGLTSSHHRLSLSPSNHPSVDSAALAFASLSPATATATATAASPPLPRPSAQLIKPRLQFPVDSLLQAWCHFGPLICGEGKPVRRSG